ncbi:Nuclear poly(A) polymerase 1 [Seiridium cupressi]
MAATGMSPDTPVTSTDTALCFIPPKKYWATVDRLRMLYDQAYEKWPPHFNLIYPFVKVDDLPRVADIISSHLGTSDISSRKQGISVSLNAADLFAHARDNTIFIHDSDADRTSQVDCLREAILEALAQQTKKYRMNMTIGQSDDLNSDPHKFLLQKAGLIPPVEWQLEEISILVREKAQINGQTSSQMKLWGSISLKDFKLHRLPTASGFYDSKSTPVVSLADNIGAHAESESLSRLPLCYSAKSGIWKQYHVPSRGQTLANPEILKVASYNVLAEFHYPPSQTRYPLILRNLLAESGLSDVLVLEEVTDDFLCYLLADENIRREYPFVSNGPPDQLDIEPLPSHLNIVILSKWSFTWDWVSFKRRHKGSIVLQFDDIGKRDGEAFVPVILATVHLTCGLTDGSVAAKKTELQVILKYLFNDYPQNPWILAGGFNITTSAFTINAALEKKAISSQTATYLADLETLLSESGLSDAWTVARLENTESSHLDDDQRHLAEASEGEQGATFDPTLNDLAAAIVGSGFNNRPQRYDRILFKAAGIFSVRGFNRFGKHVGEIQTEGDTAAASTTVFASDHWGIRCALRLTSSLPEEPSGNETSKLIVPVITKPVPESLSDSNELRNCLIDHDVFPAEEEFTKREEALKILQATLSDASPGLATSQNRPTVHFVIVPVGSYGLGVWTASSDVDCLCLGSISPKVFFALSAQRLRRASSKGIKILRRVNALSGTMLELEILGVKMDLQYCSSAIMAQTWPRAMELPANSPAFTLPTQTLAKLKPARDLYYLRRTIPDFAAFRTAFHLIKTWAKQRGIYAARFGYLGGIHIAILLSRVCKLLSRDIGFVSVPTILLTFFNHYANFDWKNKMAFDPFFHKRLRYVRTSREAMVILGFHSPGLNVATTASPPSVRTISEEFRTADQMLSRENIRWVDFLGTEKTSLKSGPNTFLEAYQSYVKIDVQFWGVSHAKGSQYVGWLESRRVMLLVDIGRRLPNIHARIWPARFVVEGPSDNENDYQGCYLIGLDLWETPEGQTMSKDGLKMAHGSLLTAIQKFEDQIRGDEKYFDAKSSWMSASIVKQSELGKLKLDHREWGEHTIGEDEPEDNEEDEEVTARESDGEAIPATAKKLKKKEKELPVIPAYTGKFRSSGDVISRIRWDPAMDSGDYLVGYEDRFLGIKERALDQWKAEQTDEEFIPQHRIMYFKRISDGIMVWDRTSRRDMIFGSGVQSTDIPA